MNGVAMVASEPVRNDGNNAKPIEVRNYQQPAWKALSDFALQSEIEQPAFQQLVSMNMSRMVAIELYSHSNCTNGVCTKYRSQDSFMFYHFA